MGIILAIIVFGLIIFVHELGHFLLAKLNGIRVDEFSIGRMQYSHDPRSTSSQTD